jgi:type II secretion system protein C
MLSTAPSRIFAILRIVLVLALVAVVALAVVVFTKLPKAQAHTKGEPGGPSWPAVVALPTDGWQVFQRSGGSSSAIAGPVANRYRLAGTFFLFADATTDDSEDRRRAIVDDLQRGQQVLVGEGELIDEFEVSRVHPDHIVLRQGAAEYVLSLSFGETPVASASSTGTQEVAEASTDAEPALETNRFGKRVGFNRWVYSRDALMGYYQQLLDDPERIAALYLSLKPDYKNEQISGYRFEPEGEDEFFRTIGMMPGDVVRKVNSMNMTSQKRAEYFISEFVKNRLNAFVFDIEREGKPEKLIYLIR